MIRDSNFLLGMAYSLLMRAREHFIINADEEGLAKIEDQFQELKCAIENTYYKDTHND